MEKKSKIGKLIAYILLTLMSIVCIAPFLWMLSTSLKEPNEIFVMPPVWIPEAFDWKNYVEAWNAGGLNFGLMFYNTLLIVLPVTIFTVLASSLASYSFARIKLKGRKKYVLTNKGQDEIVALYPNVICEAATKSEWGLTRMMIDGPEDIVAFEGVILEAYEEVNQILQHS